MKIKAVIWDIGGVLVRTTDRAPRTRQAERLGLTYAELEDFVFGSERGRLTQLGKIKAKDHWRWVCAHFGLPPEQAPQFRDEFFAGDTLDKELLAYIRNLHKTYRSGIISNAFDDVHYVIRKKWRMADAFDHIIASSELGVMKPDSHIFEVALWRLGVTAAESIFIDDNADNFEVAQVLGLHAVRFRSPQQAIADIESILNS